MKEQYVVLMLFISMIIRELWTLVPYDPAVYSYFPFYEIKLTLQTYLYFPCQYVAMMLVIHIFSTLFHQAKVIFKAWFWLQVVEFVDYFFTYNTSWFSLKIINQEVDFGITIFRGSILFLLILVKFITWKQ